MQAAWRPYLYSCNQTEIEGDVDSRLEILAGLCWASPATRIRSWLLRLWHLYLSPQHMALKMKGRNATLRQS